MLIEVLKSKIHRVKVTDADLSYIGSITIDRDLIDAANFVLGEKVQVVNTLKWSLRRPKNLSPPLFFQTKTPTA